YLLRMHQNW
ncbi:hypothetical protein SLEP1_g60495, partial [Rubroshorea leprosula]